MKWRSLTYAGLFLISACASDGNRPLRREEIALAPYREGPTQSVVGSFMYEGRCLLFRGDEGATRLLPIWPQGSFMREQLIVFHRPAKADQRVAVGEEVRLDGSPATWEELPRRDFIRFRTHCGGTPFIVSGLTPAN